ncbi:hypothetical protein [Tahibacter amnicola]|uniref:Uncharacterized protein n=1 Tax=Tahibacter amnicola TaxID=2976241 RepID=A0ABY6BEB6_9GAMM|nr:hypothetical protein [Tahibacter amnicola]UXI68376.1 hypothetical protein N4264_01610 [Tahibacter amnicola]
MADSSVGSGPTAALDLQAGAVLGYAALARLPQLLARIVSAAQPDDTDLLAPVSALRDETAQALSHAPALSGHLRALAPARCIELMRAIARSDATFFQQLASTLDRHAPPAPDQDEALVRAQRLGQIFAPDRLERITRIMGSYRDV